MYVTEHCNSLGYIALLYILNVYIRRGCIYSATLCVCVLLVSFVADVSLELFALFQFLIRNRTRTLLTWARARARPRFHSNTPHSASSRSTTLLFLNCAELSVLWLSPFLFPFSWFCSFSRAYFPHMHTQTKLTHIFGVSVACKKGAHWNNDYAPNKTNNTHTQFVYAFWFLLQLLFVLILIIFNGALFGRGATGRRRG